MLLALALRTGAAVYWQARLPDDRPYLFADTHSYWYLAQQILRGEPYEYGSADFRIFRTPGYPLLLAGWFRLAGTSDPPVFWARMLSVVAGTLAVATVMLLAHALFDFASALFAGSLAAVYPGAIATSVFVLSEAPFIPLLMLQLYCWVRACGDGRWSRWALAGGLMAGLATLVRPSWLLFIPFALPFTLLYSNRRHQFRVACVMLFGLAVVMLPWWIRNWRVSDRFVATSLQMGASLYDGWNPAADGGSDMRFVPEFYRDVKAEQRAGRFPARQFEWELDRRMREAALAWARAHPRRVVQLAAVKVARMWSPWPNAADIGSFFAKLMLAAGYVPLILLGIAATVLAGWKAWPYGLCVAPALYLTGLHMVFVSSIRYREPAMLPLIVLGAGVAMERWRARRGQSTMLTEPGKHPPSDDPSTLSSS